MREGLRSRQPAASSPREAPDAETNVSPAVPGSPDTTPPGSATESAPADGAVSAENENAPPPAAAVATARWVVWARWPDCGKAWPFDTEQDAQNHLALTLLDGGAVEAVVVRDGGPVPGWVAAGLLARNARLTDDVDRLTQALTAATARAEAAEGELEEERALRQEAEMERAVNDPVSAQEHNDALSETAGVLCELTEAQHAIVWLDDFSGAGACADTPADVLGEIAKARKDQAEMRRLDARAREVVDRLFAEQRARSTPPRAGEGEL
jgi:hypothetical protein